MLITHPTFDASAPVSLVGGLLQVTNPPQASELPHEGGESQPSPAVPPQLRQPGEKSDTSGPRNAARGSNRLPGGWTTTREEIVIAGRGWIYQHASLSTECEMDPEWAEEILLQRLDFFTESAGAYITGNPAMARRIHDRLARRHAVN